MTLLHKNKDIGTHTKRNKNINDWYVLIILIIKIIQKKYNYKLANYIRFDRVIKIIYIYYDHKIAIDKLINMFSISN
jgi:hypothetical protein